MSRQARDLDADVVLEKPVKLLMLIEAIRKVTELRAAGRAQRADA